MDGTTYYICVRCGHISGQRLTVGQAKALGWRPKGGLLDTKMLCPHCAGEKEAQDGRVCEGHRPTGLRS